MQTLNPVGAALTALRSVADRPARTVQQENRSQTLWGAAALATSIVLLLAAAALYLVPPGQQRVTVDFAEAGLIKVGDGVRVAGIPVGRVQNVTLAGNYASVGLSIDSSVDVGNESSAEVRLLTIVGGHYIELLPSGRTKLARSAIPVARTTLPYGLTDVLQQAAPKLSRLDANPLRNTLIQLQEGFGNNPGAFSGDVKILSSMLANLNARQNDFGSLLTLASEYTKQLNADGDVLTALVRSLSSFLTEYSTFSARFNTAIESLASLLERVRGAVNVYDSSVDPLVRELDEIGRDFGPAVDRFAPLITQGRDLIARLEKMVRPDGTITVSGGAPLVLSSDLCIPLPGVNC